MLSNSDPRRKLRGRRGECAALDRLVASVRAGRSQVLVLRGEAGVGKSALAEYLVESAAGCRIARAAGVESEMELAFAGLHQLCAPMMSRLDCLPGPQRDALAVAFGLSSSSAPDRFLVGLAVLSLLAEMAEEQPLVCVVDDAQWLDRVSAQTLAFVARRLQAERVALVFAVRGPTHGPAEDQLVGLPELVVRGLRDGDARALLDSVVHGRLDKRVKDRIVAETRGNPLALLELPRGLTPAELAGGFGLPDARPLESQIEQSFLRRIGSLPIATQRLLLAAAAEPVGDVPLLRRVAERLAIGPEAVMAAEAAGLIEFGARVRFRHPLVRSAAYRAAGPGDRQDVHRALAEATDPESDPDRRAWHRAHAAVEPDEAVAGELERSADRAHARGGIAAAAAFLRRAAELTPDPARRGARALAAARASLEAGAPDAALELLAAAKIGPLNDLQRAQLARTCSQIVFARMRNSDAVPLLLRAAERLERLDAGQAREAYLEALGAAAFAGRLDAQGGLRDVADAARAAPPGPQPPRPMDVLLDGLATRFAEGYVTGAALLRRALQAFQQDAGRHEDDTMRWLWLTWLVAGDVWDDEAWHELTTRAVRRARDTGSLNVLPLALTYRAVVHVHAGEFAEASALIEEADAITKATGNAPLRYGSLLFVAWRGENAAVSAQIQTDVDEAAVRGEGRAIGLGDYLIAVLYNGLGRYDVALAGAERACEHDDLGGFGFSLAELVEAGARGNAPEVAATALRRLEERATASGTEWALGILARSRALLSTGSAAEVLYREAIERLGRTRVGVHLARAHLVYGEWLRREDRRLDAREQLRTAYEMLHRFGAEAFAERARRELLATGESVRRRVVETREGLTAQEAQIARLAVDGLTNSEIGAELFISPRTVEWHLHKVFTKLAVNSRSQLRGALADT
ncbi:AAA family ATPase [Pseudonocardia alaniniphila]|uniref:AAA family ATPase n=2 Tax=Pseudonocardia alaniniphila TaxID=75291 RepID=A0ABS9TCI9_9PSEU|nr:LuxR family transcriptional regulator [Pseudonocardia alaniniphila]MCH6166265.1 AAA family ATPase [Pseudonocardia alaniniphila]